MPIPGYPVDRREAYLNQIAGGGDTKPPYPTTREEAYLDAIAEGGGGSSGGGVLVVHDVDGTLDKTWQEIHDADYAVVKNSYITDGEQEEFIAPIYYLKSGNSQYFVVVISPGFDNFGDESGTLYFSYYSASSADGYPAFWD